VPPGPAGAAMIPRRVDQLTPLGMTPITESFRQAVRETQRSGVPGTIVLVTDGLETCKGNPCAAVREAKRSGVDFVLHVVGFDVAKEDVSSLECAAQAGGGLYIPAESAADLSAALDQTMTAKSPVGEAALSVKSVVDGELHDAAVEVFNAAGKRIAGGRTYGRPETNPRLFPLGAGTYDVVVRPLHVQGGVELRFAGVTVEAGKMVEKVADFSTGELSVLVTRNGDLSDAAIRVRPAGAQTQAAAGRSYRSAKSNPKVFRLPPGSYDVTIGSVEMAGGIERTLRNQVVKSNERTEAELAFESGTLKIGAVLGAELVDATTNVTDSAGKAVAGGRTYTHSKSNPKTYELLPGNYEVVVSPVRLPNAARRTVSVQVTAGATTMETVDFAQP